MTSRAKTLTGTNMVAASQGSMRITLDIHPVSDMRRWTDADALATRTLGFQMTLNS